MNNQVAQTMPERAYMTRDEALKIARACAYAKCHTHDYLPRTAQEAADWQPHEWVLDAIRWNALSQTAGVPDRKTLFEQAEVLAACYRLKELVEGVGCERWQNANGFRLKDTQQWVEFYNVVTRMQRLEYPTPAAPAASGGEVASPSLKQIVPAEKRNYLDDNGNPHSIEDEAYSLGWNACRSATLKAIANSEASPQPPSGASVSERCPAAGTFACRCGKFTLPMDKGPWRAGDDGKNVYSDDFTADVSLRIDGDFLDDHHRKDYAVWLARTLNGEQALTQQRGECYCQSCKGSGEVIGLHASPSGDPQDAYEAPMACPKCDGTGDAK